MDWDSPPTCNIDIDGEDLVKSSLPSDQKEEYVADWLTSILYNLYPEEDEPLEEVNLSNNIAIFYEISIPHVLDESP